MSLPDKPRFGRPRIPKTIFALGLVSLLNDIGGDAAAPLLPALVAAVGGGPLALGLIEGVADATSSFLLLFSGYVADRTGKLKGLTLTGYGIANLSRPLLSLVSSWWQVLLIRSGDRMGKGIRGAPRDTLVAEAAPSEWRGSGYSVHRGLEYIGALLGPAIAYLMLSRGVGLRTVLAWTVVPGALAICVLAIFVKDPVRKPLVERLTIGLPPSFPYRRFLLAVFIFTLGSASDAFLLWRARETGIPVASAPILWMILSLTKAFSSFFGGTVSDWRGRRFAILSGWSLYAAVYIGFALAQAQWHIITLFAIHGFFYGLTEGPEKALVVDLVPHEWRGRALGTYHAVIGLGTLPASAIFGFLYQKIGPLAAFGTGAGLALIAALILPPSRMLIRRDAR
jgi:MFS family permease